MPLFTVFLGFYSDGGDSKWLPADLPCKASVSNPMDDVTAYLTAFESIFSHKIKNARATPGKVLV